MSSLGAKAVGVCAGCGATQYAPSMGRTAEYVKLDLAPGHDVIVCRSQNSSRPVRRESCVAKARAKAKLCPGCGDHGWDPGEICTSCRAKINRESQTNKEFAWYLINARRMMPYLGSSEQSDKGVKLLSRTLATAAGGDGRVMLDDAYEAHVAYENHIPARDGDTSYDGDMSAVELTAEQADAMRKLAGIIERLMQDQRAAGREEGRSLLLQLARGDMTITEFDDRQTRLLASDKRKKKKT